MNIILFDVCSVSMICVINVGLLANTRPCDRTIVSVLKASVLSSTTNNGLVVWRPRERVVSGC